MPTSSLKLRLLSLGQTLVRRKSLPSAFVTPVFRRCLNLICSDTRGMSTYAAPIRAEDEITVHFLKKDGKRISVNSFTGVTLLDIVKKNLDFEGFGACEGTLACSTCHLILEEVVYKKLDPITNEEMDLLDLTNGLTATSRLGCQVCLSKALDGMTVHVPEVVSNCLDIKTKNKDTAL